MTSQLYVKIFCCSAQSPISSYMYRHSGIILHYDKASSPISDQTPLFLILQEAVISSDIQRYLANGHSV